MKRELFADQEAIVNDAISILSDFKRCLKEECYDPESEDRMSMIPKDKQATIRRGYIWALEIGCDAIAGVANHRATCHFDGRAWNTLANLQERLWYQWGLHGMTPKMICDRWFSKKTSERHHWIDTELADLEKAIQLLHDEFDVNRRSRIF